VILIGCILLLAGNATGQSVKVNWNRKAPFSDYRTYTWQPSKNPGGQFYLQWVVKDVDGEMARKGLQKVQASQKPDLYFYYHLLAQEIPDAAATDDGFAFATGLWAYWGGSGPWDGSEPVAPQVGEEPRMMGILALDMVDARKGELVWRGQATVDALSNRQKGDEKQVLDSVKKMLKHFPPEGSH
jgi:hypothetical protein